MKANKNDSVRRARHALRIPPPERSPDIVFEGAPRPGARLQYYGTLYGSDSYANVSGAFAHALADHIPDVSICNYVGGALDDPVLALRAGLNYGAPVAVFQGFPTHIPERFFEHPIRIGVFVCEADQILPEWVRVCNRLHLIAVPSRFCRETFLRSGVTTPIMIVPHGVHPEHRPRPGFRPRDRFVFYNTFRHQVAERKSYPELIRCFQAAFQGRDDVVLRLRAGHRGWLPKAPGAPDYGGLVQFDPPGVLNMSEAAGVYSEVHCTVHPSKGEGFGLVPLESIACETPVIAPAHTGMADYLTPDNARLLRHGAMIRAPRAHHLCGRYHGVDEEHLVESLREAVEEWPGEQTRLAPAAADIRQRFAWPVVLQAFLQMVDQALECTDPRDFSRLAADFLEPGEVEGYREQAAERARARYSNPAPGPNEDPLKFSSIVYCGWDYPRDGVGNHIRLLDELIFNGPEIRYKSLDERSGGPYHAEPAPLASYVHHQRPDLFQGSLYLDAIGFHGARGRIDKQTERVRDARERFNARTAVYLMWESDRLWAPLVELVRAYDLTIVTSSLLADDLERHGVRFVVLPHPYRYAVERPGPAASSGERPLTMGISAELRPRKNLPLVAEAFAETLGNHADFRLRIHSRTPPRSRAMRAEHRRLTEAAHSCRNIELLVESLSRERYLEWLQSLDIYCFMSSGEGWSVTPREALHLGKPVVLLDAHVHRDFSHLPGVIPVSPGPPQPARPGTAFIDGDIGREAGVDPASFKAILRELPEHYADARSALAGRFEEIPAFHDIGLVRGRWRRALNALFD